LFTCATNGTWVPQGPKFVGSVQPSATGPAVQFGISVAISYNGSVIAAGATAYNNNRGGVYIFEYEPTV